MDGLTIGICLLQQLLVEVVVDMAFSLDDLRFGDEFLGTVDIDDFSPTPLPAAQSDLTARLCHQIGLGNLTL